MTTAPWFPAKSGPRARAVGLTKRPGRYPRATRILLGATSIAIALCLTALPVLGSAISPRAGLALSANFLQGIPVGSSGWAPGAPALRETSNASPLAITSFQANPSSVVVSTVTFLNVTAIGGTPPYTYWFSLLPPGCASLNRSSLGCLPTAVQHYTIAVRVNDSVGAWAEANTTLVVTSGYGAAPLVVSFQALPATVAVFHTTHLIVNATSRSSTPSASLTYSFLGLPPGCPSFNQTDLVCIPTAAGSFHLRVFVTDGFADLSFALATLNVTPAPSTASTSPVFPSGTWYLPVMLVLLLAVAIGIVIFLRRGARRPPGSIPAIPPAPPAAPGEPSTDSR